MSLVRTLSRAGAVALLLFTLCACSVRWLPDHDPALFAKLTTLNEETMVLFSAVSPSTPANTYARHQPAYDKLIGGFEALRMVAVARPVPSLGNSGLTQQIAERACGPGAVLSECLNATPSILDEIILTLQTMRDTHKRRGLSSDLVVTFRQSYLISADQILVLEAALKR